MLFFILGASPALGGVALCGVSAAFGGPLLRPLPSLGQAKVQQFYTLYKH